MDLKQLEYFVEFCQDMNYSRAAKRLFITPQGLSKAIHLLEDELEIPLTTSVKGRIELTTYGEYLAKRSTYILGLVDMMQKDIVHMYQLENNNISINLSNSIRVIIYADVHNEFLEAHPDISLDIHEYKDMDCEEKLLTGELDAAVVLGPLNTELFQTYHLFNSTFTMMMHKSHPLANKKMIGFDDLRGVPLVAMDESYKTHHLFAEACRAHGVEPDYSDEVDGALDCYYMCRSKPEYVGSLIGYLPQLFASGGMRYIPFDPAQFSLKVELAILKGRYRPYALNTYIEFIRNYDYGSIINVV